MAHKKQLYVKNDDIIQIISGDSINTSHKLEKATYKVCFSQMSGFYLEETEEPKVPVDKVYGASPARVEHLLSYYNQTKDNVGVLLSGTKGLGKSLMAKLLCKKLYEEQNCPIVIVDRYFQGLKDFLSNLKNTVIMFDEFEKVFSRSNKQEEEDHRQEEMLTLFDGTSSNDSHNMYILIVNRVSEVNEFLLSRPGRIRYHYRFTGLAHEDIEEYCEDNINMSDPKAKVFVKDLCAYSAKIGVLSYDVLTSVVDEFNKFKSPLSEIMDCMNVHNGERISLDMKVKFEVLQGGWEDWNITSPEEAVKEGHESVNLDLTLARPYNTYFDDMDCRIEFNTADIEVETVGYLSTYKIAKEKIKVNDRNIRILAVSLEKEVNFNAL